MEHSNPLEHVFSCPICGSADLVIALSAKDYFHSGEEFSILSCPSCKLLITSPRPSAETIGAYYNSHQYLSHGAESKGFIGSVYRTAQQWNLKYKFKRIAKHVPRGTWCDYGAGDGSFVRFVKGRHIPIDGYEPSTDARHTALDRGTTLYNTSNFITSQTAYSCITLWHVLEHIPNLADVLHDLVSHLTPDGVICVAVPNPTSLDAQIYKSHWAALDVPRHFWHFAPESIIQLFNKVGLECCDQFGLPLDAYYISILSEKYQKGNSLYGIINGARSNINSLFHKDSKSSITYIFKKRN